MSYSKEARAKAQILKNPYPRLKPGAPTVRRSDAIGDKFMQASIMATRINPCPDTNLFLKQALEASSHTITCAVIFSLAKLMTWASISLRKSSQMLSGMDWKVRTTSGSNCEAEQRVISSRAALMLCAAR